MCELCSAVKEVDVMKPYACVVQVYINCGENLY